MAFESDHLDDLYDIHVLPHARATARRGRLQNATCSTTHRNPRCGDEVRLDLAIDDTGHVSAARFDARGCLISQAAADLLCEFLEGKAIDEIGGFTAQEMLELLRVPLTPGRLQCGLLAFEALKMMTDSLTQAVR